MATKYYISKYLDLNQQEKINNLSKCQGNLKFVKKTYFHQEHKSQYKFMDQ